VLDSWTGEVVFVSQSGERVALSVDPYPTRPTDVPSPTKDIDAEVVQEFPYPIARRYSDFLSESDSRIRCNLLIDTFTALIEFWAVIVVSDYLHTPSLTNVELHRILEQDLPRPLISTWKHLLKTAIAVLEEANVVPFAPDIQQAYHILEGKQGRIPIPLPTLDTDGNRKYRMIELGHFEALINYRNNIYHGFTASQEQARKELDTYLPILRTILRSATFLKEYTLWLLSDEPNRAYRLMGAIPHADAEEVLNAPVSKQLSPFFLCKESSKAVLPLHVFIDVETHGERDVLLFHGIKSKGLLYVSTTGRRSIENEVRLEQWRRLLSMKPAIPPISNESLTLSTLRSAALNISNRAIQGLVRAGKYIREVSVDRADLSAHIESFDRGNYGAFVLGGESGIGKSTLLARLSEQRIEQGDVVLFYRASVFSHTNIRRQLLYDLGYSDRGNKCFFRDFLVAADQFLGDHKCFLIVDALNEFPGDMCDLICDLDSIVEEAASYQWFRVIMSVRDGAYRRLSSETRFGNRGLRRYYIVKEETPTGTIQTPLVTLGPITGDHLDSMYNAYRAYREGDVFNPEGIPKYSPLTPFQDLASNGSTVALLRSPLMARLIMEAFNGKQLTSSLRHDKAMRLYEEEVISEKGVWRSRVDFLKLLVAELDLRSQNIILREELDDVDVLREHMENFEKDSAYVQLVGMGVLLEEWAGEKCSVRFSFDRLFEYFLARRHGRVREPRDFLALAERAAHFHALRGTLEVLLARDCEEYGAVSFCRLLDHTEDDLTSETREQVCEIAVTVLHRLTRERDPALHEVFSAMAEDVSGADVDVLTVLAERLMLAGEPKLLDDVLELLNSLARRFDDPKRLIRALLTQAHNARIRGTTILERHSLLTEARDLASSIGDERSSAWSLTWLGLQLHDDGNASEARDHYEDALARFQSLDDVHGQAIVKNLLGVIALRATQFEEASDLFLVALNVHREQGNNHGIAKGVYNLGMVAEKRGDIQTATTHYKESYQLYKEIDNRDGQSLSLGRLGLLSERQGDFDGARRMFTEAKDLAEALGWLPGMAIQWVNLGYIERSRGELEAAEQMYSNALQYRESARDMPGVACTRNVMGVLATMQRRYAEAEEHLTCAIEIAEECGETSSWVRANVYLFQALSVQGKYNGLSTIWEQLAPKMDELNGVVVDMWRVSTRLLLLCSDVETTTCDLVREAIEATVRARREMAKSPPDLEDGPAMSWWLAAQWFSGRHLKGDAGYAAGLAIEEVGARWWPYLDAANEVVKGCESEEA